MSIVKCLGKVGNAHTHSHTLCDRCVHVVCNVQNKCSTSTLMRCTIHPIKLCTYILHAWSGMKWISCIICITGIISEQHAMPMAMWRLSGGTSIKRRKASLFYVTNEFNYCSSVSRRFLWKLKRRNLGWKTFSSVCCSLHLLFIRYLRRYLIS